MIEGDLYPLLGNMTNLAHSKIQKNRIKQNPDEGSLKASKGSLESLAAGQGAKPYEPAEFKLLSEKLLAFEFGAQLESGNNSSSRRSKPSVGDLSTCGGKSAFKFKSDTSEPNTPPRLNVQSLLTSAAALLKNDTEREKLDPRMDPMAELVAFQVGSDKKGKS